MEIELHRTFSQYKQVARQSKDNPSEKTTNYANFGKEQFIKQPLLVNATAVPDQSLQELEMSKPNSKYENPTMVNNQLANLGLDGQNSYIVPFDITNVVQTQINAKANNVQPKFPMMEPATTPHKRKRMSNHANKTDFDVSDKYKKLVETVSNMRQKRQNEERIGKLYGARYNGDDKLASVKSRNKELQAISKLTFEKPVVFSLEG